MLPRSWTSLVIPALLVASLAQPAAAGDDQVTVQGRGRGRRPPLRGLVTPQDRRTAPDQEPAFARGYADGYERGRADSREGDRYDPVGHRNYRSADQGYSRAYGSRGVYRDNYRAGFREGYDDGYRAGTRSDDRR